MMKEISMRGLSFAFAGAILLLLLAGCGADSGQALNLAYRQGFEAIEAHDFVTAERALAEAARLAPDDPYVALNLGVAYQNLGQLDQARAAYLQAIETGGKTKPTRVTDPHYAGRSVADLARDNLASLPPR